AFTQDQLGVGGAATSQNFDTKVYAYIGIGADVDADGSVLVDAADTTSVIGIGGAIGISTNLAGIGIGVGNINMTRVVQAYIDANATVDAKGLTSVTDPSGTLTGRGVLVDASASDSL